MLLLHFLLLLLSSTVILLVAVLMLSSPSWWYLRLLPLCSLVPRPPAPEGWDRRHQHQHSQPTPIPLACTTKALYSSTHHFPSVSLSSLYSFSYLLLTCVSVPRFSSMSSPPAPEGWDKASTQPRYQHNYHTPAQPNPIPFYSTLHPEYLPPSSVLTHP